jgi:geranylgeranyl pyrophosphate synthase
MGKSLPIAYALEVLPENETNHLEELLDSINEDEFAKEQAINIVEKTGAVVFIETKKDQYKNKALAAIDFAAVDNSAKRLLLELVDYLTDL